MSDLISRQAAVDAYGDWYVEEGTAEGFIGTVKQLLEGLPSAEPERCEDCGNFNKTMLLIPQPERLTDDDFETIRGHLEAYKEELWNRRRWEEAEEYQRIIDRFMAFAYAKNSI